MMNFRLSIFIAFIFLIQYKSVAQENYKKIGFTFNKSSYYIKFNNSANNIKNTKSVFNYSAGISYISPLDSSLFLKSGVTYISRGIQQNFLINENEENFTDFNLLETGYISIPLYFQYSLFNDNNIEIRPSAGIVPAFSVLNKETLFYNNNEQKQVKQISEDVNEVLIGFNVGSVFSYNFSNRLHLYIEPSIQIESIKINNQIMNSIPIGVIAQFGVLYNLNLIKKFKENLISNGKN